MRLDRIYKLISLLAIEYQCDVTNDIEFFTSWDHLYGLLERGRLMKFLNLSYNCLEISKTETSQWSIFTVTGANEAGVDFVLIQPFLVYYVNPSCSNAN